MDKETLSNYGWIVICTLVLAVMLALATPFGEFIRDGVWSTTNGLNDTLNKNMEIVGLNGGYIDGTIDNNFTQYKLIPKAGTTGIVDEERKLVAGVPERSNPYDYFEVTNGGYLEISMGEMDRLIIGDIPNGTGAKLTVYSDSTKSKLISEYLLVVFGDADKNGLVNTADLGEVNNHVQNAEKLDGVAFYASDLNLDNSITNEDVEIIFQHYGNIIKIPIDLWEEKDGDYYPKYSIPRGYVGLENNMVFLDCPAPCPVLKSTWKTPLENKTTLTATLKFNDGTTQTLVFEAGTGANDKRVWFGWMNPDLEGDADNIQIGCGFNMNYNEFSASLVDTHDLILVNAADELVNLKSITIDGVEIVFENLKGGRVEDNTQNIFENISNVKNVILTFNSGRQRKFDIENGAYMSSDKMDYLIIDALNSFGYYVQGADYDQLKYIKVIETVDGVDTVKTYSINSHTIDLQRPW
jgi:hypothetical protein